MSLRLRVALRFVLALPILAVLLFVPAGSLSFWQAWLFMALFFGTSLYLAIYFYRHDPELLERRLQTKERVSEQKLFRTMWVPLWICGLSLTGLDNRLGWSRALLGSVPLWLVLLSQGLVLCSYFLVFQVLRANSFASSIVKVEADQKVISTGPYRVVRHPMYSGILVLVF